jgi:hypothetical protein
MRIILTTSLCLLVFVAAGFSQTTKRNARPAAPQAVAPEPTPTPIAKRNERPQKTESENVSKNQQAPFKPNYIYEFDQPSFDVSHVVIEHDEAGRGKITFMKRGLETAESEPLVLTQVTMDKIKAALTALNFLNSTEMYQTVRDYSHMGNITFTYRRDEHERTVKYNWTDNVNAKALMDEYRRISNQYTWQFEMEISRENQPLNAPSLVDALESYLRRNEISDPAQLVPYLKALSNDERIPLIARNHAGKIAEKIEKTK